MNIKHHKFVTEYLKWGDQVLAYKNAYNSDSSYKSLQSAANRLLNDPEVANAIYESEARIRCEVEIAIANRQIKEILTIEEKRTLLKQIAAGTMYVEQKYKGKNCTQCSQYISPTINQMLAAIREDNKLAGHYPHKQNGKWVIPALQNEEEIPKPGNTIDNISPRPNDEIGRATNAEQENVPEISLPGACPEEFREGIGGELPQGENTNPQNLQQKTTTERSDLNEANRKDSNYELTPENEIDNQPLTQDLKTHDAPTVNSSGRIISQEQLSQLLYPKHPKLTPMENNT